MMEAVKYWNDGWRFGVIHSRGPKFINILDVGTLRNLRLPRSDERDMKSVEFKSGRLANRIECRRRMFARHGIRCAAEVAKAVALELRNTGKE